MGGVGGLGGGAFVMWENFTCWDPHDRDSVEGTFEFFENCDQLAKKKKSWGRDGTAKCVVPRGATARRCPGNSGRPPIRHPLKRTCSDTSRRSGKPSIQRSGRRYYVALGS